ncbi:guanine nucleotide exchange factor [Anaeramoeba flamelloides]|uniref:Guanine nucleotide exchange factor n=1 Tax=Anaeramoeba flamelloides TaxID=1746091 RepID=A0AAV8ADW3_9EUKA|nr:guanine nucleotide exchange factor [Anaeramoeba flamelloides]
MSRNTFYLPLVCFWARKDKKKKNKRKPQFQLRIVMVCQDKGIIQITQWRKNHQQYDLLKLGLFIEIVGKHLHETIQIKLRSSEIKTCEIDPEETRVNDVLIQLLIPQEYGLFVTDTQASTMKRKTEIREKKTIIEDQVPKTRPQKETQKAKQKPKKKTTKKKEQVEEEDGSSISSSVSSVPSSISITESSSESSTTSGSESSNSKKKRRSKSKKRREKERRRKKREKEKKRRKQKEKERRRRERERKKRRNKKKKKIELDSSSLESSDELEKKGKNNTKKKKKTSGGLNKKKGEQKVAKESGIELEQSKEDIEPEYIPESEFRGKFADRQDLIWKYHGKSLEIRERPPTKIDLELMNVSKEFQSNLRSFSTNLELREIINELAQTDNSIRSVKYGIVFTHSEAHRRDVYIPAPEEVRRGEQLRVILEQSDKFGVWGVFQKGFRLEGYLSKIDTQFDLIQISLKPIVVGIILQGNKEIEILVDSNCPITEICKKLIRNFGFKTSITKQKKKLDIIYNLYKVEYGIEGDRQIITQLHELDSTKSLGELNVTNGSKLKLVRIEKEPENKKKGNVSSKMNFWREFGSGIQNLTFCDQEANKNSTSSIAKKNDLLLNKISGVSLNKLIEYLTSGYESKDFIEVFLLLLPTFTNETTLLDRLLERYDVPSILPQTNRAVLDNERLEIQRRVIKLIYHMVKSNPHYLAVSAKKKIQKLIVKELLEHEDDELKKLAQDILYYLKFQKSRKNKKKELTKKRRNTKRRKNKNATSKKNNNNKNGNEEKKQIYFSENVKKERMDSSTKQKKGKITKLVFKDDLRLEQIQIPELARQITLYTHHLYSKFKTNELFDKSWTRRNKKEIAPNIIQLIGRFNFLADWASTLILGENELKLRIKSLSRVITLANELLKLNNFNDMFSIISGLQNSAVIRLDRTFKRLPKKIKKIYQELDSLTDVSQGCKKLMDLTKKSTPPTVPYLAEYLKVLLYIDDLPDKVDNGLINWRKRMRMFEVVTEIKKFQIVGYNFHFINKIKKLFFEQVNLTEDEMWERSCIILPPPNYN